MTIQIAALASGTGSNVTSIIRHIEEGKLDASVRIVLSDRPNAPVLEKARAKALPVWARRPGEYADKASFDQALLAAIQEAGADTVVLAGYMRMLSAPFIQAFVGRILNIHPSLLPSFPGLHGCADALRHGVRVTGSTVHFVDELMDNGPVIIQAVVPVSSDDTEQSLFPRIQVMEHRIYPQALQWLAENRLHIDGRRVLVWPPQQPNKISPISLGENRLGSWMVSPPLEEF